MKENLFELSDEAIDMAKMMYNGKVVKCLVAPYHSYGELEKKIPYSETTYLFPEREMSAQQVKGFISMVVKNPKLTGEVRIVTKHMSIIGDMIHTSVKILTEGGDIVDAPNKTFCANIHDIRYEILENPVHQLSSSEKDFNNNKVNEVIEWLNDETNKENPEYYKAFIENVGEPIIKTKLREMYSEKMSRNMTEKEKLEMQLDYLIRRKEELERKN